MLNNWSDYHNIKLLLITFIKILVYIIYSRWSSDGFYIHNESPVIKQTVYTQCKRSYHSSLWIFWVSYNQIFE